MQVRYDVAAVRDEDPSRGMLESFVDQIPELLEEGRDVDDGPGTDQIHAIGVQEP